jgi:hypothetical protein
MVCIKTSKGIYETGEDMKLNAYVGFPAFDGNKTNEHKRKNISTICF